MGHKCTAASAQRIARQIDPRWTYDRSLPPGAPLPGVVTTTMHDVVTATGPKRIEARHWARQLVLRCPFTAEQFVFRLAARAPVGHAGALTNALGSGWSTATTVVVGSATLVGLGVFGLAIAGHVKHASAGWYFHRSAW